MNYDKTIEIVHRDFDSSIIPGLKKFVEIPNLSPAYDPNWETDGLLERAGHHLIDWAKSQGIKGLEGKLLKEKGRAPMVCITIPPTSEDIKKTILLYGHFDKQPHMEGWIEGTGPLTPVIKDGYLYGRGASDDGYSTFTIIESIKAIQEQGGKHGRIFVTIEGGEESGSVDLMYYLRQISKDMGKPDLMVCMDSGCGDYNTLWVTTSLRGVACIDLKVEVLKESVHSGTGSGIAPDSFNIMRILLDRINDAKSNKMCDTVTVKIPEHNVEDAKKLAEYQKERCVTEKVNLIDGVNPLSEDYAEILLNNTWRPTLTVVGITGLPSAEEGGNVLHPSTEYKLSIRLPPTLNAEKAGKEITDILVKDPPYNAKVSAKVLVTGNGFASKDFHPKIKESFRASAQKLFGMDYLCYGEGGSIPFISELGQEFPECDILVTGVLGPKANAHCPNECLNIAYTESMTVALAHVLNDYCS